LTMLNHSLCRSALTLCSPTPTDTLIYMSRRAWTFLRDFAAPQ
jgi:hypothetical protein